MAYSDVALLSMDNDFIMRTRSCYAIETTSDPISWSTAHAWPMAATPTFGDKYASALANGIVRPGNDPSVISDPDILAAVQHLMSLDPSGGS
jgi:hypothetical protein